jgi:hypothetical protein
MNFTKAELRSMRERIAAFEHEIWCIQTAMRSGDSVWGAYHEHHPKTIRQRRD